MTRQYDMYPNRPARFVARILYGIVRWFTPLPRPTDGRPGWTDEALTLLGPEAPVVHWDLPDDQPGVTIWRRG